MNFVNPYYYTIPSNIIQPKIGLLGRLFGSTGVSIANFLNGTQRVLNIANQTIPIVKQIKPMVSNAKTMFKIMNEFKKTEKPNLNNNIIEKPNVNDAIKTNEYEPNTNLGPQFFI